jgi:hypothetical protein
MNEAPGELYPNCCRCAAFYITHDPTFPYGCRAVGFRSRKLPCIEVLESSGEACLMFTPKRQRGT